MSAKYVFAKRLGCMVTSHQSYKGVEGKRGRDKHLMQCTIIWRWRYWGSRKQERNPPQTQVFKQSWPHRNGMSSDDWRPRPSILHSPIELRLLLQASLGDSQQILLQLADSVRGLRQPPPHLLPLLWQALRRAQQLLRDREAALDHSDRCYGQSQQLTQRGEVLDKVRSLCNTHD